MGCRAADMILAGLLCIAVGGCASGRSSLPKLIDDINGEPVVPRAANRILVPDFRSSIGMSTVAERLTLLVRERISMDGRLAVVKDGEKADLLLEGLVRDYEIQPMEIDRTGRPEKKRMRITASARLVDTAKGRVIFHDREIQAFEIFSDLLPPVRHESLVRESVIQNLARRIALKVITGWYTELMSEVEKGKGPKE